MNKLFEIKTTINYHEYRKFCDAIYPGLNLTKRQQITMFIVMALITLPLFFFGYEWLAVLLLILIVIIPIFTVNEIEKSIKKSYETNKIIQDVEYKYIFSDKSFKVKELKSNATVLYAQLYKVIETNTNYYLLVANNSGYIIAKKDIDHKKDFKEFLKQKTMDIYKNKSKKKH